MGLYDTSDPNRAGIDVAQYNGWSLINIIKAFSERDMNDFNVTTAFKRAILISDECTRLTNFGRINA